MSLDPSDYADDQIQWARTMMACPWYAKTGDQICASGCWSEPSCETDRPSEGWEAIAALPLTEDESP